MNTMVQYVSSVIQVVRILSATAEKQVQYLNDLGEASVDELGLEFEEVCLQADAALESKGISQSQYDSIKRLNEVLDQISGEEHEALWTQNALIENQEWEQVRRAAKECLSSFGQEI